MIEVRRATAADVSWLIEQAEAFEAAAHYKYPLLQDYAFARRAFEAMVEHHVVLIAHEGERRMGFIAGYRAPHPFNPNIAVLSETFWWVPLAYRGSSAGAKLLFEFENVGRFEADWVVLSLEHDSPLRADHLAKRGFRQVERAFLLEV